MKNAPFFFALGASLFFSLISCSPGKTAQKTSSPALTPLTLDTLVSLGLQNKVQLLQLYTDSKVIGVKDVSERKSTIVTDDGRVIKRVIDPASDTLLVAEMTKGVVLEVVQHKKFGLMLKVGFDPDATIQNKKFLIFALSSDGVYNLILQGKEGTNEYFTYGGDKYFVVEGSEAGLLFALEEQQIGRQGQTKKTKGKVIKN